MAHDGTRVTGGTRWNEGYRWHTMEQGLQVAHDGTRVTGGKRTHLKRCQRTKVHLTHFQRTISDTESIMATEIVRLATWY